jgi:hypothetical protein
MGIEKERAKRRQAEQARQNQPQAKKTNDDKTQNKKPVTDSGKGQSRDAVGEKVGVNGKTVRL